MNPKTLQLSALSGTVGLHLLAFALLGGWLASQVKVRPPQVISMEMVAIAPSAPTAAPAPAQTQATPAPKPQPKAAVPPRPAPPAPSKTAIAPPNAPKATPAAASPAEPAPSKAEAAPAVAANSAGGSAKNSAEITPPLAHGGYLNNSKPRYPQQSIEDGEEGTVQLRVHVSVQGTPEDVTLAASSGFPRLDRAALAAVKRWRFTPAKRGDEAIAYTYTVPVQFSLKSVKS
ncbi:energy transducer TonB [Xenophilus sp. AP218F]|nr:energy transducer TonB [Xenophilus sp. AP218F]